MGNVRVPAFPIGGIGPHDGGGGVRSRGRPGPPPRRGVDERSRMIDSPPAPVTASQPAADPTAAAGADPAAGSLPPCPDPLRHPLRVISWLVTLAAGVASLLAILAVLAAIPVANVLALGYMLEAEGRVARSGRLRDGLPLSGILPRLGAVAVGTWAWLLVVRLVTQAAADAALVAPGSGTALAWERARIATAWGVGLHLAAALFAGGAPTAFVRPIRNARLLLRELRAGTAWSTTAAALERVLDVVRPGRLFWLGLRGYLGALAWLLVPTVLFSALRHTRRPVEVLVTLLGAVLLALVLPVVPFMQARFAADGRWRAFVEVGAVRELYRRAPLAMLLAVVVLYGLSLPLSLLKVLVPPRDALLFITPIFVLTIYPARLVVGWATAQAGRKPRRQWLAVRALALAALVPLLGMFLFLLFLTPTIGALGRRVLFDHHALLLPTPF